MITKEIAVGLRVGTELRHKTLTNADGKTPYIVRVNGACKTWKTNPRFRLSIKRGLYEYGYITPANADEWEVV